jgi:ABC-type nitrate/sulfonate/bicarbonate transport system permease component
MPLSRQLCCLAAKQSFEDKCVPKPELGNEGPLCYVATMKFLRSLHLYLGCLFAPMLIFFAVTGSWQLFNWHESKKDKTYTAPPALATLSFIHKDAHVPGTPGRQPTPLRYFMLATAIGLVTTTIIGIVMAYRFSQRPLVATVSLFLGIALPGLLLWIYR